MKTKNPLFSSNSIIVVLFIFAISNSCQVETDQINPIVLTGRIVLIGLDGISVEGYNVAKHPNLDQLADEGALSLNTRASMPSLTLPNWTTHLTGSGPEQHGVVNNEWKLNNYVLSPMEKDDKGYYPSIFKILKEQIPNMKTAFYFNWAKLIEPYNRVYIDEIYFLKDDSYEENFTQAFDFIVENRYNPTFVFLYTAHTDHAGHKYGWMSPKYIESIEDADVYIGELMDKLKSKGLYKDTHFMFLTDHGGIDKGHGGVSPSEMVVPWGISGQGIKKGYKLKAPNNTFNTAVTIAYLFRCEPPSSWIGSVPMSIFE